MRERPNAAPWSRTSAPLAAALALAAAPVLAQSVSHAGADAAGRLSQAVELLDAWGEKAGDDTYGSSAPRDVLVRVVRSNATSERVGVNLVLFGPWGSHLYAFDEAFQESDGVTTRSLRTTWLTLDLDEDGRNEIVLVERTVVAKLRLDEMGEPLAGDLPVLVELGVRARLLDREGATLVERDVPADPASAAFSRLLEQPLDGAVHAALQHAAADFLFAAHQFEKARYRYQAAREWAEREMLGSELKGLSLDSPLPRTDPDEPAVLWIAARRRMAALPPRFRDL